MRVGDEGKGVVLVERALVVVVVRATDFVVLEMDKWAFGESSLFARGIEGIIMTLRGNR